MSDEPLKQDGEPTETTPPLWHDSPGAKQMSNHLDIITKRIQSVFAHQGGITLATALLFGSGHILSAGALGDVGAQPTAQSISVWAISGAIFWCLTILPAYAGFALAQPHRREDRIIFGLPTGCVFALLSVLTYFNIGPQGLLGVLTYEILIFIATYSITHAFNKRENTATTQVSMGRVWWPLYPLATVVALGLVAIYGAMVNHSLPRQLGGSRVEPVTIIWEGTENRYQGVRIYEAFTNSDSVRLLIEYPPGTRRLDTWDGFHLGFDGPLRTINISRSKILELTYLQRQLSWDAVNQPPPPHPSPEEHSSPLASYP
ncbi:hypothetical protein ACLEPN_10450 [Myxococcus sp. 1LA]